MIYTNSSLVDYIKLSPNHSGQRNHTIDCIAIHCVVGQCSVETMGRIFAPKSMQASCNYGIGYDGKVGMYVEEKNRSWCTSSALVDNRAITIECASDTTSPYAVNSLVYEKLIKLVVDICKRNNIKKLLWKADKSLAIKNGKVNIQANKQNIIAHRWINSGKSCPGDYLYGKMSDIANRVNKALEVKEEQPIVTFKPGDIVKVNLFKAGDKVKIKPNAIYYNGIASVPDWVIAKEWYLDSVSATSDRCVIGRSVDGKNNIKSAISSKYLEKVVEDITYVVQRGDYLSKIANKYGKTWQELASYNNIKNPSIIYIGQKIKIPK